VHEDAAGPDRATKMCPSAECQPGSILIGVIGVDGRIQGVAPPIPVTTGFVSKVHGQDQPLNRFRFGAPCIEYGCGHWDTKESRCGVARALVSHVQKRTEEGLPICGIRAKCRWFSEYGREACIRCPSVLRDPV